MDLQLKLENLQLKKQLIESQGMCLGLQLQGIEAGIADLKNQIAAAAPVETSQPA